MYKMSNSKMNFSSLGLSLGCASEHSTRLPSVSSGLASLRDGSDADSLTFGSVEFSASPVRVDSDSEDREIAQMRKVPPISGTRHPARDLTRGRTSNGLVLSTRVGCLDYMHLAAEPALSLTSSNVRQCP